ncbi:YkvA family protein [Pseudomonas sp. LS44]|uniref:YkvA family protein n=1 Tax=Pseudomonas sp. LS44 TaxID=1357074 RepID=UPI00215B56A4|nr:YkvA family protein [Pseudomonas sp. LS44]UVE16562.1 YkvA family protein [Pseudomonas sp. LS44]
MKAPWKFDRYLPIAQRFLSQGRLPLLLLAVARKSAGKGRRLAGVKDDLLLLQSLCIAWWRGEYRAISKQALLSVVAALAYFLSPLDAIPDFLLGVGFVDDFAVLAWLMSTWRHELDAFRTWREAQSPKRRAKLLTLPSPRTLRGKG